MRWPRYVMIRLNWRFMKQPLQFILKLMLIIIPCFILVVFIVMPQYEAEYMASLRDKYARVRAIKEPKILLVGGSNVAFGFDSALLEAEMQMPVVNFGLHANLTQAFASDLLKPHINSGDIIVIAPEYYHYPDQECDYVLTWLAIENDWPLFIAAVRAGHLGGLLDAFPTYFHRAMKKFLNADEAPENELSRALFNEWGDYDVLRPKRVAGAGEANAFISTGLSDYLGAYWNGLNDYVLARGATLYMSCPPIVSEGLLVNLDDLQLRLEDGLDFPVISQLADYVYPLDYFYDTGFHLNDYGRRVRTEQLVRDLINFGDYGIIGGMF
jgi:hypothetical protein